MHLPGTSSLPRSTFSRVTKALAAGLFSTAIAWSAANAQASGAQTSGAQTAAPVPVNSQGPGTAAAQNGPVVLNGGVVDPDGAEIPGATLTLTSSGGKAYVVQSGSDGTYAFRGVPPGVVFADRHDERLRELRAAGGAAGARRRRPSPPSLRSRISRRL